MAATHVRSTTTPRGWKSANRAPALRAEFRATHRADSTTCDIRAARVRRQASSPPVSPSLSRKCEAQYVRPTDCVVWTKSNLVRRRGPTRSQTRGRLQSVLWDPSPTFSSRRRKPRLAVLDEGRPVPAVVRTHESEAASEDRRLQTVVSPPTTHTLRGRAHTDHCDHPAFANQLARVTRRRPYRETSHYQLPPSARARFRSRGSSARRLARCRYSLA